MVKLNLPQFEFKVSNNDGKTLIFDILRKKFVVLTPEEWVRQHLIHFLITHRHFPKSLIKLESGVKYNDLNNRYDILVYDRAGKCCMVVECKSANVKITQKVFEQASRYNYTLKARYMIVSNGLQHYCCFIDHETKKVEFMNEIPEFDAIAGNGGTSYFQ